MSSPYRREGGSLPSASRAHPERCAAGSGSDAAAAGVWLRRRRAFGDARAEREQGRQPEDLRAAEPQREAAVAWSRRTVLCSKTRGAAGASVCGSGWVLAGVALPTTPASLAAR